MDNPQDSLVTSSQDIIQTACASASDRSTPTYQVKNVRKKKLKDVNDQFPWFRSFQKMCRSILGSSSMKELLDLITIYSEHVSSDVVASYSKPNRAAKLKTIMITMLGFFHNCYIHIKEPFEDTAYMEKMSDLLTMYIDMEIKASRRGKESVKKITSKLISALFIILNNSSEYILDTIMKARFTVKSYSEICIPIFKMVTNLPLSQEMSYVRCLIIFKMWKRLLPCREERNSINRLAVAKLSPPPAQVMQFIKHGLLANILPTLPPNKKPSLVTRFYMIKKFNLRDSIKAFLKMEADLRLNELCLPLDTLQCLGEVSDNVPEEGRVEQDYSLLESIWVDLSKSSTDSPDHPPTTPDSTSVGVVFTSSKMLKQPRTKPNKTSKVVLKSKSPKKDKVQKKNKGKIKKKKEELIVDLCKEYESSCTDVSPENLTLDPGKVLEYEVCDKSPPSSTVVKESPDDMETTTSSHNLQEVNSSEDLKLSQMKMSNESYHEKTGLDKEPKIAIGTNNVISEEKNGNKIVLSCKNFSKIGFKQVETQEEQSAQKLLKDKIQNLVSFNDSLNTEKLTENTTLHSSHSEVNLEKVMTNESKEAMSSISSSKDNRETENSKLKTSPNIQVKTSNDLSQHLNNSNMKTNSECDEVMKTNNTYHNSKSDLVNDSSNVIIDREEIETFKELSEQVDKLEEPVNLISQIGTRPKSITETENCTNSEMYRIICNNQEKSDKIKTAMNTGASLNQKNEVKINIVVDSVNNSKVKMPEEPVVNMDVSENHYPKTVMKEYINITKSTSTTSDLKGVASDSFKSNECSDQESSEVSSSLLGDSGLTTPTTDSTSNQTLTPLCIKDLEITACKIEKEDCTGSAFSACMKNSESFLKPVRSSYTGEKCDKSNQVPSYQSSYIINKSIPTPSAPQRCTKPQIESNNKHSFNMHKEINTCLLHKILGEEDCLKSGCLLKNSMPGESLAANNNKYVAEEISLKQELENSSELPSQNTPSPLWNPSVCIKQEKDNDKNRSLDCLQDTPNTPSEFLVRSVTEACNFKELGFNIGSECDNFTSNYDCESDCEDTNLVIDEDIDVVKDQIDSDGLLLNIGSESAHDETVSSVGNSELIKDTGKQINETKQELWENNVHCVKLDSVDKPPLLEKESFKKELAGKHKLPGIIENNIVASSFRNSYAGEPSGDLSVNSQINSSNEVLFSPENNVSCISAQNYRGENLCTNTTFPKNVFPVQPKIVRRLGLSTEFNQSPPICKVFSPPPSHANSSNYLQQKNIDNQPAICSPVVLNQNEYITIQSLKNKPTDSFISGKKSPLTASKTTKITSHNVNRFETYTQYNVDNKVCLRNKKGCDLPSEKYHQRNSIGQDKYISLDNLESYRKLDSTVPKFKENCIKNATNRSMSAYIEGSNMKENSDLSFHNKKYKVSDPKKVKSGEVIFDKSNSYRDPLYLVKSKDDTRETYDFECNVFPVAHEVEVCSASENIMGDWIYPGSNEIGHPDWPIANEQNVVDSSASVSYTHSPEQYLYAASMQSEQGCTIGETDQTCFNIPLELQQVDSRYPSNIGNSINKEKLNLHLRTLEGDFNLCCSQRKFKEFYLSQDVPPTIPVPYPPQSRTENFNSVRCPCEQCCDNHQKLLSNYNVLTHFRNSKVKPLNVFNKSEEATFSDKDQNGEFDSSLPLKKRRTLTSSKASEEPALPSYPNTPMISIAQLELTGYDQGNQVIVPNPQSHWRDTTACNPLNLAQCPSLEPYDGQTKSKRKTSRRRKSTR